MIDFSQAIYYIVRLNGEDWVDRVEPCGFDTRRTTVEG